MPRRSVSTLGSGILPLSVRKSKMSHLVGRGQPELLLQDGLGTSSVGGGGFGVSTPSRQLMSSLERLSLKGRGSGKKGNIRFSM